MTKWEFLQIFLCLKVVGMPLPSTKTPQESRLWKQTQGAQAELLAAGGNRGQRISIACSQPWDHQGRAVSGRGEPGSRAKPSSAHFWKGSWPVTIAAGVIHCSQSPLQPCMLCAVPQMHSSLPSAPNLPANCKRPPWLLSS